MYKKQLSAMKSGKGGQTFGPKDIVHVHTGQLGPMHNAGPRNYVDVAKLAWMSVMQKAAPGPEVADREGIAR